MLATGAVAVAGTWQRGLHSVVSVWSSVWGSVCLPPQECPLEFTRPSRLVCAVLFALIASKRRGRVSKSADCGLCSHTHTQNKNGNENERGKGKGRKANANKKKRNTHTKRRQMKPAMDISHSTYAVCARQDTDRIFLSAIGVAAQ